MANEDEIGLDDEDTDQLKTFRVKIDGTLLAKTIDDAILQLALDLLNSLLENGGQNYLSTGTIQIAPETEEEVTA